MKYLFVFFTIAVMASCNNISNNPFGQGGKNAAQFVKEQVPEQRDNIASIETFAEDSLLSDIGLTFASIRAERIKVAFFEGSISRDEADRVLDSCKAELMAVEQSWKYGAVSKKIKKYEYQWRKVYTVRVTMKSGDIKEPRVLMDQDGITPRMLESDFVLGLLKYNTYFNFSF